jgi:hypothetical protein
MPRRPHPRADAAMARLTSAHLSSTRQPLRKRPRQSPRWGRFFVLQGGCAPQRGSVSVNHVAPEPRVTERSGSDSTVARPRVPTSLLFGGTADVCSSDAGLGPRRSTSACTWPPAEQQLRWQRTRVSVLWIGARPPPSDGAALGAQPELLTDEGEIHGLKRLRTQSHGRSRCWRSGSRHRRRGWWRSSSQHGRFG